MRVRVRLFAGTRAAVGASALDLDLPPGARVADVLARACEAHPALAPYQGHALLALDGRFVPGTTVVHEGAVVAIMPPVSGGSGSVSLATPRCRQNANKPIKRDESSPLRARQSDPFLFIYWRIGLLATLERDEGGMRG